MGKTKKKSKDEKGTNEKDRSKKGKGKSVEKKSKEKTEKHKTKKPPPPPQKSESPKKSSESEEEKPQVQTSQSVDTTASNNGSVEQACSKSNVQLEKLRERLLQIDSECRDKIEQQEQTQQKRENEKAEKIREENQEETEKAVKGLQEEYKEKIQMAIEAITAKQQEEMANIRAEDEEATKMAEKKQQQLEKDMTARKDETAADIEQYRKRREAEAEEQVKRVHKQCEDDIKDFTAKRMENYDLVVDQLKQKLELEMKNQKQKDKLEVIMKLDKVKERAQKEKFDETTRLNQAQAQAIVELRARKEVALEQAIADMKKSNRTSLDKTRVKLEEKFKDERLKIKEKIEGLEDHFKDRIKQEQRELERRKKTKQELLVMLAMPDTRKLTDEEFIATRYGFKIERSEIMVQSSASTIYKARREGAGDYCFCKVTMLNKWSVRHRTDFTKHSTRLIRYLTANHSKAPYFVKVLEVLATDTKVYTFTDPLDSSVTVEQLLNERTKVSKNVDKQVSSGLTRGEVVNLLGQVTKAIAFLNNNFIAHANLTADNITVLKPQDLTECKLVLTGLTRPLVFFNVETDLLITIKGFDAAMDGDSIDHLPPECFEPQFTPTALDSYSVGVLAYRLVRVRSPYVQKCGTSAKKMLALKQQESVHLTLSDSKERNLRPLPALITALTLPEVDKRLQVEDILGHGFFKQQ